MSKALEDFLRGLFDRGSGVRLSVSAQLGTGYDALAEEDRKRAEVCAFVRSQLGKHYHLGVEVQPGREQETPEWDCSELVEGAYRLVGHPIPDGSPFQFDATQPVKAPKPGDLGFLWSDAWERIGHVMVYVGGGHVIHAVGGRGVVEDEAHRWEGTARWKGWRRHHDFLCPPEERA